MKNQQLISKVVPRLRTVIGYVANEAKEQGASILVTIPKGTKTINHDRMGPLAISIEFIEIDKSEKPINKSKKVSPIIESAVSKMTISKHLTIDGCVVSCSDSLGSISKKNPTVEERINAIKSASTLKEIDDLINGEKSQKVLDAADAQKAKL